MNKIEKSKRDTREHIWMVNRILSNLCSRLVGRAGIHDLSKLEEPELSTFAKYGPLLKELEYGSDEYKIALAEMGEALKHHYAASRHHPEHFKNGVDGMNLIDLVEMIADWVASSRRVKGGDFLTSLEINRKRFKLSPQLVNIIANSSHLFEEGVSK